MGFMTTGVFGDDRQMDAREKKPLCNEKAMTFSEMNLRGYRPPDTVSEI